MTDSAKTTRWKQRFQNLEKAFTRLQEGLAIPQPNEVEKQGIIQSFEFTFELAWKTMQDLLLERGYVGTVGPRPVIEQAFKDGIILDGETWMKMLMARNLTVHSYNEKTAEEIASKIRAAYFPLLSTFLEKLRTIKDS